MRPRLLAPAAAPLLPPLWPRVVRARQPLQAPREWPLQEVPEQRAALAVQTARPLNVDDGADGLTVMEARSR